MSSEVAELIAQFVELTDQRKDITDRMMEVEDLLVATLAGVNRWTVTVPGLPSIKRHGGKKRTAWQHDDLFAHMRTLALDARWRNCTDDGQIESPDEALLRHIKRCAHVDYWRAEDLRTRGIKADEYARVSYGRQTIEIMWGSK